MSDGSSSRGTSLLAAIVWFAVLWLGSYLADTRLDLGRHRTLRELVESEEALLARTFAESGERAPFAPPRWQGAEDEPARVLLLGTSPTRCALPRSSARRLEKERGLEIFKVAPNVTPIDRTLTRLEAAHGVAPLDVLVLEVAFPLVNDHLLGYRDELEVFPAPWDPSYAVRDPELLRLKDELGLPPAATGPQAGALRELRRTLERNVWEHANPNKTDFDERPIEYALAPRLFDHHVLSYVLARVTAYCAEQGIGVVVWVPPVTRSLVWYGTGEADGVDPDSFARRALDEAAERHGFEVLDFHDWSSDEALFSDPLHLDPEGAEAFGSVFFRELGRVLKKKAKRDR